MKVTFVLTRIDKTETRIEVETEFTPARGATRGSESSSIWHQGVEYKVSANNNYELGTTGLVKLIECKEYIKSESEPVRVSKFKQKDEDDSSDSYPNLFG